MEKSFCPYFYSMPMHKVFVLLGSNLGRRKQFLSKAKEQVAELCGKILKESSVYETAAWGNSKQASFLNQVIIISSDLSSDDLMKNLLLIENKLGRVRKEKFGPRTIDLDILFHDDLVYHSSIVTIPHPAIQDRRFVLIPLIEIAPRKKHPVYLKTVSTLLKECTDMLNVKKF
jgi:2-amino-4-hydroxy-6-hydroxymethyldihydropteridine diphosphokinase